jgi:hypothetical protein
VEQPSPAHSRWRFAALLVPLVALVELTAQAVITARVPKASHWRAAAAYLRGIRQPGDLVTSAPLWTDPLARQYFADMIPLRDAARPDATRYRRALVATIRGRENPDLRGWRETAHPDFGPITVRTLENPSPATVRYDLLEHLHPPDAEAFRVAGDNPSPCEWRTGAFVAGGGLGQGALAGPDRFFCSPEAWNYIGATVIEDMEHRGRQCIWSHPIQGGAMVTRFRDVPIGTVFHGHHGIAYEAERGDDLGNQGGPVELRVLIDGAEAGRSIHRDGEGWKGFEIDTRAWANTTRQLTIEVRAEAPGMRHYCYEGDVR